jgi:hypothetical protein
MSDEQLADLVFARLKEFSPALSIRPGDHDDQVLIEIAMSRTPYTAEELAELDGKLVLPLVRSRLSRHIDGWGFWRRFSSQKRENPRLLS